MDIQELQYQDFITKLNPDDRIKNALNIFIKEHFSEILSKQTSSDNTLEAYTIDLKSFLNEDQIVTVYPNEIMILSHFVGPGVALILGNPIPLLSSLCTFLVRFRTSKHVHKLDKVGTAVFLVVNQYNNNWVSKDEMINDLIEKGYKKDIIFSQAKVLISIGVLEKHSDEFRVVEKYRS